MLAVAPGQATAQGGRALLDGGSRGDYSWSIHAFEGGSSASCLEVAITHRHSRFSYDRSRFRRCAPTLGARSPALISGGRELGRGDEGMTVLALAFAPGVERARLTFAGGRVEKWRPQPLPDSPSGRRLLIVATPAVVCLTGVAAITDSETIWSETGEGCLPGLP